MAKVTRRGVLGLGAATLGGGLLGPGRAGAFSAGAPLTAIRPAPYSLPDPPSGTVALTLGAASFSGLFESGQPSSLIDGTAVARDPGPGVIVAELPLPVGARLRRLDAFAVFGPVGDDLLVQLFRRELGSGELPQLRAQSMLISLDEAEVGGAIEADEVVEPGTVLLVVYQETIASGAASVLATGVVAHYEPPARSFVPVTPFRVYDSRWSEGPLSGGTNRLVSVANARDTSGAVVQPNAVPPGAVAITYNLTVTGANANGLLSVTPGTAAGFSTATINWDGTNILASNASTVAIDANRQVRIFCDGAGANTHAVIDVTGFYI